MQNFKTVSGLKTASDLKTVSDADLLAQIKSDAAQERKSGLAVIHALREVAARRLDARLGYPSLHRYCMEELKYSSGSAWRRIEAMRALGEMPDLEAKIERGELTLANVSQVQSFCQAQAKTAQAVTPEEKRELFEKVEGLSKREAERVLAEVAPLPERPDKVRAIDAEKTELRVTLDRETLEMLDHVRDLLAHAQSGASYADVIVYLAKLGVQKLDPAADKRPRAQPRTQSGSPSDTQPGNIPPGETAAVKREVWKRDGGVCQYTHEGRKCGARALAQPDHIIPEAKGGAYEASNLILKCRRHNLLAAIDEFGWEKMRPFLKMA